MLNVCYLYVTCMLHVCYLYVTCMLHACYMYVKCMLPVCYMYVKCMLPVSPVVGPSDVAVVVQVVVRSQQVTNSQLVFVLHRQVRTQTRTVERQTGSSGEDPDQQRDRQVVPV